MAKKLSGLCRMFIVFAGVWTVLSIGFFLSIFLSHSHPIKPSYEREKLIEKILKSGHGKQNLEEIQRDREKIKRVTEAYLKHKRELRQYHKDRRNAIFLFLLYWLPPIGLVYGSGRCAGWIIRGFRKED